MNPRINRRRFLAGTAGTIAATATPGIFDALAAQADPDPMVMGQGAWRFRRDEAWTLKSSGTAVPVKDCHEMVRTPAGNLIFCTNHTANNLIEFSPDGRILRTFGTTYPGAHGLTYHDENGEGVLWLTDTTRRVVVKMDMRGKEILTLGWPQETGKYDAEKKFCPTETAINPANGDIYVADGYGSDWLIHYTVDGGLIGCYKHEGFKNIHGVAYDARDAANPKLLVTSRAANKLFTLSLDGKNLGHVDLPGAWICRPVLHGEHVFLAVINSGRTSWGSDFRGFVLVLDKENKPVSLVGGLPPGVGATGEEALYRNIAPKPFLNCHDVCLDAEGSLYVPHWNSNQTYPYKLVPVA